MIRKFHVQRLDTKSRYVRSCDDAHMLARRVKGKGPIKVGDRFKCVSKLDDSIYIEEIVKIGKVGTAPTTDKFLLKSDAMGINPDQYQAAMRADAELGMPIEYDEAGRAVFRSKRQYRRYAEAHGFFDRNGGYESPKKRDERERDILNLPPLYNEEPQPIYLPGVEMPG